MTASDAIKHKVFEKKHDEAVFVVRVFVLDVVFTTKKS